MLLQWKIVADVRCYYYSAEFKYVCLFFQQYFDYKLRNATVKFEPGADEDDKTLLQTMYESYFSVAAQVPNVVVQILNTGLKHK